MGTTNFEMWSLAYDDEINVVVLGPEFGKVMEQSFAGDLRQSRRSCAGLEQKTPSGAGRPVFFGLIGALL